MKQPRKLGSVVAEMGLEEGARAFCWLAQFDPKRPCSGRLDPAHIIAQRVIKRQHALANPRVPPAWFTPSPLTGADLDALLADPRNWRPGCRAHHHAVDNHFFDYPPPDSAREFAAEWGLDHYLPAEPATAEPTWGETWPD